MTGPNTSLSFPEFLFLRLDFSVTFLALCQTSSHTNSTGLPIYLQIVALQPGEYKD